MRFRNIAGRNLHGVSRPIYYRSERAELEADPVKRTFNLSHESPYLSLDIQLPYSLAKEEPIIALSGGLPVWFVTINLMSYLEREFC